MVRKRLTDIRNTVKYQSDTERGEFDNSLTENVLFLHDKVKSVYDTQGPF